MLHTDTTVQTMIDAVADLTDKSVLAWRPITERGYSGARRLLVSLSDGSRAFVKTAVDDRTTRKLRAELVTYSQLRAPFLPQVLGWREADFPILILEDLTDAAWPPPWSAEGIEAVLSAIGQINATPPPPGLPRLEEQREVFCGGWA